VERGRGLRAGQIERAGTEAGSLATCVFKTEVMQ
jgi:hypothetical protein